MLSKQSAIVGLVGVNLFLLALMVLFVSTPRVEAQAVRSDIRPGDFICATAQAFGQSFDVLYILDVPERKLHAFIPDPRNPQNRKLMYGQFLDLNKAFRPNNR